MFKSLLIAKDFKQLKVKTLLKRNGNNREEFVRTSLEFLKIDSQN